MVEKQILTTKEIPAITQDIVKRFRAKVAYVPNPFSCWNWKGWIHGKKKPYGVMSIYMEEYMAHRLSYYIHNGVDPKEMHVLHKCDNHRCVNPNHLFLGTNADNVADKMAKGRHRGADVVWNKGLSMPKLWDNPQCALTKDNCIEAKDVYEKGGVSLKELGRRYGASKKAISGAIKALGGFVPKTFSVLTKEQVISIREKYSTGLFTGRQLGKEYNIGDKTIMDIVHRKTWKHI